MDEKWRFSAVSITKYNPEYRDKNGDYFKDEWISFADVGKSYNGVLFTLDEYLLVERKYIDVVIKVFDIFNYESIYLDKVYIIDSKFFKRLLLNDEVYREIRKTKNKIKINKSILENVLKAALRRYIMFDLVLGDENEVVIRFGFDYYMYVNSDNDLESIYLYAKEIGLFVER